MTQPTGPGRGRRRRRTPPGGCRLRRHRRETRSRAQSARCGPPIGETRFRGALAWSVDASRPAVTDRAQAGEVLDGVSGGDVRRAADLLDLQRRAGLGRGGLQPRVRVLRRGAQLPDQPALDLEPDRQEPAVGRDRPVLGHVGAGGGLLAGGGPLRGPALALDPHQRHRPARRVRRAVAGQVPRARQGDVADRPRPPARRRHRRGRGRPGRRAWTSTAPTASPPFPTATSRSLEPRSNGDEPNVIAVVPEESRRS